MKAKDFVTPFHNIILLSTGNLHTLFLLHRNMQMSPRNREIMLVLFDVLLTLTFIRFDAEHVATTVIPANYNTKGCRKDFMAFVMNVVKIKLERIGEDISDEVALLQSVMDMLESIEAKSRQLAPYTPSSAINAWSAVSTIINSTPGITKSKIHVDGVSINNGLLTFTIEHVKVPQ